MPFTITGLPTVLAALAVVIGLVLMTAKGARSAGLVRRMRGSLGAERLALQETLTLDRLRRLHVIRCDGRDFVLLTGGATDLVVGWLPVSMDRAAS